MIRVGTTCFSCGRAMLQILIKPWPASASDATVGWLTSVKNQVLDPSAHTLSALTALALKLNVLR